MTSVGFVLAATAAGAVALPACGHTRDQQCPAVPPSAAFVPAPAAAVVKAPAPAAQAVDPSQIVARVNATVITVSDVQQRLNKQSPLVRAKYATPEKKKEFLASLIRFEVMADEAERRGYDRHPEVIRVMKQQMISKFLQLDFEAKLKIEDVPAADVEAYYRDHAAEFGQRPLAEVRRQIQQRLFRDLRTQAIDAFIIDLKRRSRIEVRAENLDKVVVDTKVPADGGEGAPAEEP